MFASRGARCGIVEPFRAAFRPPSARLEAECVGEGNQISDGADRDDLAEVARLGQASVRCGLEICSKPSHLDQPPAMSVIECSLQQIGRKDRCEVEDRPHRCGYAKSVSAPSLDSCGAVDYYAA